MECGCEIGRHDGVPLLVLHAHEQVVAGDAGVVDEDPGRAVARIDVLEQRVDRDPVAYVEAHAFAAALAQMLTDGGRAFVGGCGPDDARTGARECIGDRAADAARGAGDERNLPGELAAAPLPVTRLACARLLLARGQRDGVREGRRAHVVTPSTLRALRRAPRRRSTRMP